jgi:hypothetical protein
MRTKLESWTPGSGWSHAGGVEQVVAPGLVLCFAAKAALEQGCVGALRARYPQALVAACSTGGEIIGRDVTEAGAAAAVVSFDHTRLISVETETTGVHDSFAAGARLALGLREPDLRCVIVLADGLSVNGAALVEGLRAHLGAAVTIVGGLAGDGADFSDTRVGLNAEPSGQKLLAIGLIGAALEIGSSSQGGWDAFGPLRRITKSDGPVLFELDGQPALALYKRYLGEEAANLPASALLFPLAIHREGDSAETLVRTIVGVDEATQSLTFAGEMPLGYVAQLMRGAVDRIVSGAAGAAHAARLDAAEEGASLGLLISCIGRRLMLGQRVQEEVEAACDEWPGVPTIGFYSYGEIGPHGATGRCTLHNQTMTTLLLTERSAA